MKTGEAFVSAVGHFATDMPTQPENRTAFGRLPGRWIDAMHGLRPPKSSTLEMERSGMRRGHGGCLPASSRMPAACVGRAPQR